MVFSLIKPFSAAQNWYEFDLFHVKYEKYTWYILVCSNLKQATIDR